MKEHAEKVERICSHVRAMFDVKVDHDFVPRNDLTEMVVKDLSDKYEVDINLLHKILFK
jgi:hypothetical protein